MAQQHINYSTPNDGLGDTSRTSQVKAQSNFTELYNNKVDKETGKSLTDNNFSDADKAKLDGLSNDAATQSDWLEGDNLGPAYIKNKPTNLSDFFNDLPQYLNAVGSFHYSDSRPYVAVTANVEAKLENDTLGVYTNVSNAPFGISTLWNPATNQFDFSQLAVGDLVSFRPDLNLDLVGTNASYKLYMKMAIGSTAEWTLNISNSERKSTSEFNDLHLISFDIANIETRDYPAEFYILTDADATVKVNGWYIEVVRKNINVIDIVVEVPLATSLVTGTVKTDITEADPIVYTKASVDDLLADKQDILTIDATPTDGSTNAVSSNGVFDALALKENTITAGTTAQYYRGDKTFQTLDKTAVGLANVDNTTDANKPISTATQTALNEKQSLPIVVINTSVSGTYDIDWGNDTYDIVITGTTALTESNLPASGRTKTISIYVTGNFALTLPANWATNVIGTYSTTKLNQLVVEYRGATKYWLTINQGQ